MKACENVTILTNNIVYLFKKFIVFDNFKFLKFFFT